jgi:threonyl-tRNA synthetase
MPEKSDFNNLSEKEQLERIRHSAAHIMADAVLFIFPDAKIAIGPSIDNGFYYDFDLPVSITPELLEKIEKKTKELIKAKLKFEKKIVTKEQARQIFKDQKYKLELIEELPENEEISTYTCGSFTDLCRGPHVESSAFIKANAVKLLSTAGAYWRGDEKNPMLQRIYGTAWKDRADLDAHLKKLKEIKERDHRVLGKSLDLFSLHPEAGAGLVYWTARGSRIRNQIEMFWKQAHYENGYELLYTPHVGKSWLWETSGHLGFYDENMYSPMQIDDENYYIKPMNCPFHILLYNDKGRSYRELPMRLAEMGTVYRYERSGVLHGLLRVRGFTQDDAHIICTPEQIEDEIIRVLKFSLYMWESFGFKDIKAYLATRPEKSVGEKEQWDKAALSLEKALESEKIPYEIDEGGGAFYGPKIDLKICDAIGREWQMTTIQFDFNLPERFDMSYIGPDGKKHRPYMVHRALLGSLERFFGVLIEHYKGAFPVWLMPEQAMVIPVGPENIEYSRTVFENLQRMGIRTVLNDKDDPLSPRVKEAQNLKIPYVFIIGHAEQEKGTVSLRLRHNKKLNDVDLDEAINMVLINIKNKD